MLNYVWLFLIVLGIGSALFVDVNDLYTNKYNKSIDCWVIRHTGSFEIIINKSEYNKKYNEATLEDIKLKVKSKISEVKANQNILAESNTELPKLLKTVAISSGEENDINFKLNIKKQVSDSLHLAVITPEKVSFVKMKEITSSALSFANSAVEIVLGLIGIMALWLGIMKIAEESGLIKNLSLLAKPIMKYLFPSVPSDHPAVGAIIMNLSATFLGLGNAATPFGIKAMEELNTLNDKKDTASDAMCMFLVLNTASFALMPATAIALRAALGSSQPAIIIGTTMFGSFCATLAGVFLVKLFQNFPTSLSDIILRIKKGYKKFGLFMLGIIVIYQLYYWGAIAFLGAYIRGDIFKNIIQVVSILAIPFLIGIFVTIGVIKKVKIYETFIEGAKEGFKIAVTIIPYLVAILVAIGIFRTGGAMDVLIYIVKPVTTLIGMPPEVIPMALMRPLSGSGSLGILAEIMKTYGADSFIGVLASTMFGSTETTFFVLAVYFGAVNIKKTRYALPAGLLSDLAGFLAAIFIVRVLFAS